MSKRMSNEDVEYIFDQVKSALHEMREIYGTLDNNMKQMVIHFLKDGTELLENVNHIWKSASDEEKDELVQMYGKHGDEFLRLKEQLKISTTRPSRH